MPAIDSFWAVIPAGGAGTRLWPLSRRTSPKFLHDLTGSGRSLLQETHDRLAPLVGDRFLVVTGRAHQDAVAEQLGELGPEAVLAEPSPRDSMAAIGLAAALLERRDPTAVMGSFAADHVITGAEDFEETVRQAVAAARDGWLVTIGIEPTSPSPAFGYIHLGDELPGRPGTHAVQEFVEKPSTEVAEGYLATGAYRWNAGMFVVKPAILLDLLGQWHPDFATALRTLAADLTQLDEIWPTLPRIAVDHAIAEPAARAGRVVVVPSSFGWDDLGDFDSLATLLARATAVDAGAGSDSGSGTGAGSEAGSDAGRRPRVLGDPALVRAVDATGLVVPRSGRVVAVVGLDDVVVVDTPDAVLVTTRARAQLVKQIVAALTEAGHDELT